MGCHNRQVFFFFFPHLLWLIPLNCLVHSLRWRSGCRHNVMGRHNSAARPCAKGSNVWFMLSDSSCVGKLAFLSTNHMLIAALSALTDAAVFKVVRSDTKTCRRTCKYIPCVLYNQPITGLYCFTVNSSFCPLDISLIAVFCTLVTSSCTRSESWP